MNYADHYKKWNLQDPHSISIRVEIYKNLLRRLNISSTDKNALDIGCGDGVFVKAMSEHGITFCQGIDTNKNQIEMAQKNHSSCKLIENTLEFLHNHKEHFELITCIDLIEHIQKEDQVKFLEYIHHALKPNGRLIIKTPNANFSFGLRYRYIDWTHECSYTEHSIEYILQLAGFRNITITEAEISKICFDIRRPANIAKSSIRKIFRFFRRLEAIVELGTHEGKEIPLSPNLLIDAKK